MSYFDSSLNENEMKKLWRKLARENHPDFGGDTETMKDINTEYENALKGIYINSGYSESKADWKWGLDEEVMSKALEIMKVATGLNVEICGVWIWVTGDTRKSRKELKGLSCRWSAKKSAWYWRRDRDGYRRWSKKGTKTLNEIRDFYGSHDIKEDSVCAA